LGASTKCKFWHREGWKKKKGTEPTYKTGRIDSDFVRSSVERFGQICFRKMEVPEGEKLGGDPTVTRKAER